MYRIRHKASGEYLVHVPTRKWDRVRFAPGPGGAHLFPTRAAAEAWAEEHRGSCQGGWREQLAVENVCGDLEGGAS